MAEITVTIPDEYVQRILTAFDETYLGRGYYDEDIEEWVWYYTKAEWAQRQVARFVREVVRSYEANLAAEDARLASLEETEVIVIEVIEE